MGNPNTKYETGVWYGWNGGECPVHPETVVEVQYPNHTSTITSRALQQYWIGPLLFRIVTPYVEPPPKLERWANVYPGGGISIHETKDDADTWAKADRIRCARMVEADE